MKSIEVEVTMYLKTTNTQFLTYGEISDTPTIYNSNLVTFDQKRNNIFEVYDVPVSFYTTEGIAMIVILNNKNMFEKFVLHRRSILNARVPFLIIPLTSSAIVEISIQDKRSMKPITINYSQDVTDYMITPQFAITNIYSYYYSVKGQNYNFSGEKHTYWELTYVDTGEISVTVDDVEYDLKSQNLMIFLPNQFHKQRIKEKKSCSYLTIMFEMDINEIEFEIIKNRVFKCSSDMYLLINSFIKNTTLLEEHNYPHSGDLMISYLQIILNLLFQYDQKNNHVIESNINPVQTKFESELADEIRNYIIKQLSTMITVEDLCTHFSVSRSTLQTLFLKYFNESPMQYINKLKMKEAKRMLSEEKVSITEVSINMGYSSIHYFSRKFKNEFGISPSEFSKSVFKEKL